LKAVERIDQFYLLKQLPKATALLCEKGNLLDASISWLELFGLPPQDKNQQTKIFTFYPEVLDLGQKLQENNSFTLQHNLESVNGI